MAAPTLAELVDHRCQITLEWISDLPEKERFYQFIYFQVELARLDFDTGQVMQEIRTKQAPGSQRAKALRSLSDCRLIIHTYLSELERRLQSLSGELRSA